MPDPITAFTLSCPPSTTFYICTTSPIRFIGCCAINPCATVDGACPPQWVKPMAFDAAAAANIPVQECVLKDPKVRFYKCADTQPTFLGCCALDACASGGCPRGEVRAAMLSGDEGVAGVFMAGGEGSEASLSASSTSSSRSLTTSSRTSSSKSISTSTPTTSNPPCKSPAITSLTSFTACTILSSTPETPSTPSTSETISTAPTSTSAAFISRSERASLSNGAVAGISVVSTIVGALIIGILIWYIIKRSKRQPADPAASSNEFLAMQAHDPFPHVPGSTGRPFTPPHPSHYPPPRPYYLHQLPRSPHGSHRSHGSHGSYGSQRSPGYPMSPSQRPPPRPYTRYVNTPPFSRTRTYPVPTLLQYDFTHPRAPPVPVKSPMREDGLRGL